MKKMLTPQQIAMLRALKGQTCVFYEKWMICTVAVAEVIVDATVARFVLQPMPTPGFAKRLRAEVWVGAVADSRPQQWKNTGDWARSGTSAAEHALAK